MSQIEEWSSRLIQNALQTIAQEGQDELITDFHILVNGDAGEVRITDDTDEVLASGTIDGFEEKNDQEFQKIVARNFKQVLSKLDAEHAFDTLNLFRPFSFVLVDEDGETLEELYVVDSETIMADGELLKGLDDELNDFLTQLLEN